MFRSRSRMPADSRKTPEILRSGRTTHAPSDLCGNHDPFRVDVPEEFGEMIANAAVVIYEVYQSLHSARDAGIVNIGCSDSSDVSA